LPYILFLRRRARPLFGLLFVQLVSIKLVAEKNIRLEVFPEESTQCLQMKVCIATRACPTTKRSSLLHPSSSFRHCPILCCSKRCGMTSQVLLAPSYGHLTTIAISLLRRNAVHQVCVYGNQGIVNASVMHGDIVSPVEKVICHDVEKVEIIIRFEKTSSAVISPTTDVVYSISAPQRKICSYW
ncbi:hypothetical protein KCU73_g179, partial [Aureobasidium melanogenum]